MTAKCGAPARVQGPGLKSCGTERDMADLFRLTSGQLALKWGVCARRVRYMRAREELRKAKTGQ